VIDGDAREKHVVVTSMKVEERSLVNHVAPDGMFTFFRKGPHLLLRACLQAACVKTTSIGIT